MEIMCRMCVCVCLTDYVCMSRIALIYAALLCSAEVIYQAISAHEHTDKRTHTLPGGGNPRHSGRPLRRVNPAGSNSLFSLLSSSLQVMNEYVLFGETWY